MKSDLVSHATHLSACLPSLWYMSFHISCHGCKVPIARIPYRPGEVADVFGVLCKLARSAVVRPALLLHVPPLECADHHSTWLLQCVVRLPSVALQSNMVASDEHRTVAYVICVKPPPDPLPRGHMLSSLAVRVRHHLQAYRIVFALCRSAA